MLTTITKVQRSRPCACRACSTGSRGGRIHGQKTYTEWVVAFPEGFTFSYMTRAEALAAAESGRPY